jgi:hypothetical protein
VSLTSQNESDENDQTDLDENDDQTTDDLDENDRRHLENDRH